MTTRVVTDEQLGVLARRQNDLFRRVREGTLPVERVLTVLQDVIEGKFDTIRKDTHRLIDCDAAPFVPKNWLVESHMKGGQIEFDLAKVALHLDDGQKEGRTIVGTSLRDRLASLPVMNANVLDHLLANTNLIPDSWKTDESGRTRYIFFWGTIYRDSRGCPCVRCLYWSGGLWRWHCHWLGSQWGVQDPAAVLASS